MPRKKNDTIDPKRADLFMQILNLMSVEVKGTYANTRSFLAYFHSVKQYCICR